MRINLEKAINNFRELLCNCWEIIKRIEDDDTTGSFLIDWLQVNWELIVESSILNESKNNILEFYGDGADANGESSRILYPKLLANKRIVCIPKRPKIKDWLNDDILEGVNLNFDRLVCFRNDWYYEEPPFDKILAYLNDKEVVVDFTDIDFELMDIEE